MLKDLPLHSIANDAVLMGLKEHCQVLSEVCYSNVWYEGRPTSIRNGDRFVYVAQQDVGKLPAQVEIGGAVARVFKPTALTKCKRYGQEGHHPSDDKCPTHASEVMADTVEAFRGGNNQLSNLYVCPEGCEIHNQGTRFPSSEHHYQFKKLKYHNLAEEAHLLLLEEDSFKVMCKAKELLPKDKISDKAALI